LIFRDLPVRIQNYLCKYQKNMFNHSFGSLFYLKNDPFGEDKSSKKDKSSGEDKSSAEDKSSKQEE